MKIKLHLQPLAFSLQPCLLAFFLLLAAPPAPAQTGFGSALSFDGVDDYVNAGNVSVTGNQTIELWVNPARLDSRQNPLSKAFGGEGTITLEVNGSASYYFGQCGFDGSPYEGFTTRSNAVRTNAWTHLAVVRDLSGTPHQVHWYINGLFAASWTTTNDHAAASSLPLLLGTGYAGYFNGMLDEVRIWNVARSPAQIQDDVFQLLSGTEPGLVAYWKFDEGSGTTAHDATTNHHDGTLVNGPTWISSTVTVRDTTPPVLTCPTDVVVVTEPGLCEATVTFSVTAVDDWDPNPTIVCVPPPGSTFPVGRTNVLCTTWDASGNTNTCSFTVSVYPSTLGPAGEAWTARESNRGWESVASSADGTNLVAVVDGGQIYTSTDAGTNWTARASNRSWSSVASSADGTKLVAVVWGGQIYTSTDAGTNWTARESNRPWRSVASSADGNKLVAVDYLGTGSGGQIYTSTDAGTNWIARESNRGWISVASSADGTNLVAVGYGGQIYTSTDAGTNWTARESNRPWRSVASSADGTKLVAVVDGGQIYTSTDAGTNWTARASNRPWSSVASSADGTNLVAVGYGGQIYTSTDAGTNWTARASNRPWYSVASSADGTKLVAVAYGGQIYTSVPIPVPLTNPPTILGATNQMVEATGPGGAVATFNVTATNTCQPGVPVTCAPPSGSLFPLGTNTVTCVAVDVFGVTNTASFTVTVFMDSTPPVLTCPTNLVVTAEPAQCEATVTFSASAVDDWDPNPTIVCVPPPGSTFPVGRTNVLCTTWDASGNTNTCSFTVSVYPSTLGPAGEAWTARESNRGWWSVASSADGTNLVAVVYGGQIYTSTDAGTNWTARESNRSWYSVASSADGTNLVAVVYGGQIHTSTDAGTNWTARESNRSWYSVASSADGTRLVAVVNNGWISTSTDGGTNWTPRASGRSWYSIASSADGTKLVAVVLNGQIYTSTDAGTNWTARESNRPWRSVASSADGTNLVVVVDGGQIYTSTDAGTNWTARASNRPWTSVASSADGTRLVAVVYGGQIYTSTDAGTNWTARSNNRAWESVASSADGTRLVAVVWNGQIYTSTAPPVPLTNPPTLLDATNQVLEATDPTGAIVTFSLTATNACQPSVPVTCTPPSGSTFPLGTNTVTCVAVDAFGVTNTASFTVTVRDTTPPALNCPDLVATALPGECEAIANLLTPTATDNVDTSPTVVCVPPPGSTFPVGRTNVLCTTWDASGNTNTCSFTVSVYPYGGLGPAGEIWTARASNRGWWSVASSADGNKLVAVDGNYGQIYTSTNVGTNWTARESNRSWYSVASSADGNKLVAVEQHGQIYTSTDAGTNWTARSNNRAWESVASSADGNKLVAVDAYGSDYNGGQIYTSTDAGTNWTARESNRYWNSVASSADGTKLVAVDGGDGQIYTSTDAGTNWTARATNRYWRSVASSADGTRLVAVDYYGSDYNGGQIYTSTDAGTNWTARESNRSWRSVASSADGTKLVAVAYAGQIYTSTDAGTNWTARESNRYWSSVASSADGTRLVAVDYYGTGSGGQIYTSVPIPVPLTNPPTILDATNQVVEATAPSGAVATFNVTAMKTCQPNVPVVCDPASGSRFPLGTNTVTCVALDALGVTNTATFSVTVRLPAQPVFGVCTVAGSGQFRLQATGMAGLTYTVQTSTNLVNWVDGTTVVAGPGGLIEYLDEMEANAPVCFYRLRWP